MSALQKDVYMKIGHMVIGMLLICCTTISVCADREDAFHKNPLQSMAGLSRSASSFFPPSTPPMSTPTVSPYRDEPFIPGVAKRLKKQIANVEKKSLSRGRSSESTIIYEASPADNQSPLIFEKVPIGSKKVRNKTAEEIKEKPLSASVDSNGPEPIESEPIFLMDDEVHN